ncbi:energy-coupling factor transport system substrate-specific component [Bacilli bacterium PM5-3]|nr:energy-coupling factor transport system substrate-specific component [Bacilli bacterium PM5-3]MDH6603361.1 energy-coupling factor transport system substrate-specific component [Bacilli bacterium PM5-9]
MQTKSTLKSKIIIGIVILLVALNFIFFFKGNNYLITSMVIAVLSCIPFYYKYEKRKPEAREVIVVAVICAIAIVSRIVFGFLPGFKPIIAIIIIAGAALGKESGFMCGSLSALISNMFFGQGPWSVYQMLIWGLIGYLAGVLNKRNLMDNPFIRYTYAIICGVMFSVLIDFLTVLGSGFTIEKYIAMLIPAIPFMFYYAISNVVFLFFLYNPFMKKLNRVKLKYGLVDEKYRI